MSAPDRGRGSPGAKPAALALALWLAGPAGAFATTTAPGATTTSPASSAGRSTAVAAPAPVGGYLGEARLAGEGLLRWFGMRIYEARLWVGALPFDENRLHASTFALELRYARSLGGKAIAATSRDEIARLGLGSPAQREAWFDAMARLFPDVSAGDRLTGVHRPGRGVVFYQGDRQIGAVEDAEFGPAFFAIWLHPRTAAPELRDALLAGVRPQARQ